MNCGGRNRQLNLRLITKLLLLCTLSVLAYPAYAAPSASPWSIWQVSDESSRQQVDHSQWQYFLNQYLSEKPDGSQRFFDYSAVSHADQNVLADYLTMLSQQDPRSLSRSQQFAYWVNLYNALTVQLIVQNYPLKSIRSLGKGWFNFGPWDDALFNLQGHSLTLNDIEHRILRPFWRDARIHYVVNCASLGCPDLSDQVFTGDNNEAVLEASARRFINQDKGLLVREGAIQLSSIYEWYQSDFGDSKQLIEHLMRYAEGSKAQRLVNFQGSFSYDYNWALNEPP